MALIAWLATIPLHRRSLGGLLASVVLTGAIASVAAMVGSDRAMFVSSNDLRVGVIVAIVAGLVAAVTAAVAAQRLSRDNARFARRSPTSARDACRATAGAGSPPNSNSCAPNSPPRPGGWPSHATANARSNRRGVSSWPG